MRDSAVPDVSERSAAPRASARLGLTLRAIIVSPEIGFRSALKAVERRSRAASRPAEGVAPYVLSALGGASLFLLWLKVGGLLGLRDAPAATFRPAFVALAGVIGAILGLVAQFVWGLTAPLLAAVPPRHARLIWGLAALPGAAALALLLPLDLVLVGPEIFATTRLADSIATAWAATSVAVWVTAAAWSSALFVRGVGVAGSVGWKRVVTSSAATALLIVVLYAPFVLYAKVTT